MSFAHTLEKKQTSGIITIKKVKYSKDIYIITTKIKQMIKIGRLLSESDCHLKFYTTQYTYVITVTYLA